MEWKLSGTVGGLLLDRMRITADARECRRCQALLRLDEGLAVAAVARQFDVSRQTLYNWRDRLQQTPQEGLQDQPRSGRPSVWTTQRVQTLEQWLAGPPGQHGFHAVGWTVGQSQAGLRQQLDWTVSDYSLREKLHEWDNVWKRDRDTLKPDPLREKKDASSGMSVSCPKEPPCCSRTKRISCCSRPCGLVGRRTDNLPPHRFAAAMRSAWCLGPSA